MYNKVVLVGRIANDLELKQTENGRVYVRFSLAVNNVYNKTVDFISVIVWGQTAQNIHNYLKKGSQILVDGSIQVRIVGPENNRKTYYNINANRVVFLETKPSETKTANVSTASENTDFNSNSSVSSTDLPSTAKKSESAPVSSSSSDSSSKKSDSSKDNDDIYWEE